MKRAVLLATVALVFCAVAQAAPLSVSFDSVANTLPGQVVNVTGTITNNGPTDLTLYWDEFSNIQNINPSTLPPTGYANWPNGFFELPANSSFTGVLLTEKIATGAPLGSNFGADVTLRYYNTANPPACVDWYGCNATDFASASFTSATASFSGTVGTAPANVPEPATLSLLGAATLVFGWKRRK